jgi:hypothetical protein
VYGVFPFLSLKGGDKQSAVAGTTLPSQLMVQTVDSQGNGVAGVTVNFSASVGGGSFSNQSAITDSTGTAQTSYTLSTKAGPVGFTAAATGYRNVLLSATGVAGPATVLAKISGMGQTGIAGATLTNPLIFKLADAHSNPIVGKAINFTDTAPHGSFAPNPAITGSTGLATVYYTLPTSTLPTGTKTAMETATYLSLSATLSQKYTSGPASSMSVASGNNQIGKIKTKLANPLIVLVTDQYGNPEPGVVVTYSDGGAGGTFTSTTATTNNVGNAFVRYTLPATPQVINVNATASGLPTAHFTETAQ